MASVLLINPPYSVSERYGREMKKFGGGSGNPWGLHTLPSIPIELITIHGGMGR